jgi:hypothetical protein
VETNASNSSFGSTVENVGDVTVDPAFGPSVETEASIASALTPPAGCPVKFAGAGFPLFTVTDWLVGVKLYPVLLGVTEYTPLLKFAKL